MGICDDQYLNAYLPYFGQIAQYLDQASCSYMRFSTLKPKKSFPYLKATRPSLGMIEKIRLLRRPWKILWEFWPVQGPSAV